MCRVTFDQVQHVTYPLHSSGHSHLVHFLTAAMCVCTAREACKELEAAFEDIWTSAGLSLEAATPGGYPPRAAQPLSPSGAYSPRGSQAGSAFGSAPTSPSIKRKAHADVASPQILRAPITQSSNPNLRIVVNNQGCHTCVLHACIVCRPLSVSRSPLSCQM